MTKAATPTASGTTVSVHVPMTFRQRGGQKLVVVPNDAPQTPTRGRDESPLVKVLVRAFYWKRLIDTGEYATLADLAAAERVNKSYLSKVLRLTLLAPEIVETILDGKVPDDLPIERLLRPFTLEWELQRRSLLPRTPTEQCRLSANSAAVRSGRTRQLCSVVEHIPDV